MAVDLSAITNWLKLAPFAAWSLVVVIGLMLWGPDRFISGFGLATFVGGYRAWLGLFFLLSLIVALTLLCRFLGEAISGWYMRFGAVFRGKKRLKHLTPGEKRILKSFIDNNARTQRLTFDSGIVIGLECDDIICRATTASETTPGGSVLVDFSIRPWAWNYLRRNPTLLEQFQGY